MKSLPRSHVFFVGLMLFSLFFGAGNLIFPPILGQQAGDSFIYAISGFILTGVGLPLLTVIAIALSGRDMQHLASRVHPKFGILFAVVVYLSIGPSMGIPRVANVAFEMGVRSFVPESLQSSSWVLFVYTLVFFCVVYWLCLNPSKLVVRVGNILTPLLLISITILFIAAMMGPLGEAQPAIKEYAVSPGFKGFMEGYLTMDTIAALAFGIIVINAIRDQGVQDKRTITRAAIQAAIIAGVGLSLVYAALGFLGVTSVTGLGYAANGGQLLTQIVQQLFGEAGLILLAAIVTLACLTTCIGLVSACSQYFSTLLGRFTYNQIAFIICVLGLLVANLGLNKIISISIPILLIIYPVSIVLIILSLSHRLFGGRQSVYVGALVGTFIISIFDGLKQADIQFDTILSWLKMLPLYNQGIGWLVPAIVGGVIGYLLGLIWPESKRFFYKVTRKFKTYFKKK
ncbi:branched-chain amino acid:cation transporter, LIVCS family [Paenibacillus sp. cl6col]|nr:branched-chain amino acid transport system II carrier protein [Paenibacillus alvei]EPY11893.1 branched-chain amino acid transport system II carrier protein [Paenibacillus alvei A6-6i-x]SDG03960.1 branched-chain amino acid:cation transporter, LIVCS family [Paenibacillus sp. cl6col]